MRPRIWKNKLNGSIIKAVEWMEVLEEDDYVKSLGLQEALKDPNDEHPERIHKIGALTQVGWLLENGHNIYFGVSMKAKEQFEDLGEWNESAEQERSKGRATP